MKFTLTALGALILALVALNSHKQSLLEKERSLNKHYKEVQIYIDSCKKATVNVVYHKKGRMAGMVTSTCTNEVLHNTPEFNPFLKSEGF